MIDQSTGLQAHMLRRLIVMLFKLLFNSEFNPEHCSLCRLVSLLYCLQLINDWKLYVRAYKEQYMFVD